MNKFLGVLFFYGLLCIWPVASYAKELKVGIGLINYPPYYFEKDGVMQGAVLEISQHIADKLGHTLVFEQLPWPRIQLYLRSGEIDMVILYFKTPEREKYVIYTDTPHIYDASYLFTKKGTAIHFNGNLNSLRDYHFGHVRGYSHGAEYDNATQFHKQVAGEEKQLIRMLLNDRVEVAVGNKAVINVHANEEGVLDELSFLSPPIDIAPVYFAFSKSKIDSSSLAHDFSKQIKELLATKEYQQILKKYGL